MGCLVLFACLTIFGSPKSCGPSTNDSPSPSPATRKLSGTTENYLGLAREVLAGEINAADLAKARSYLKAIPSDSPQYAAAQDLSVLIGAEGEAATHRLPLPRIALRNRQVVESLIGAPRSVETVKYSNPTITMARYIWGDAFYQLGHLTGVECRFPEGRVPTSINQALGMLGLELTRLPTEQTQFYSWSTGPSSYRRDATVNPLVCSKLQFDPAWVSVRKDRSTVWVDFLYLDQLGQSPKRTRDAWVQRR